MSPTNRNLHLFFCGLSSCSSPPPDPPIENDFRCPSFSSSSTSSSILKTFNTLYKPSSSSSSPSSATATAESPAPAPAPAATDLSTAIAARRLLPPSPPGLSNAIADPSIFSVGFGIAVPTYSPEPYEDFRQSMVEMATAAGLLAAGGTRRRREGLRELLVCYLALNRKQAHEHILRAFSDLIAGISEEDNDADDQREGWKRR